MGVGAASADPYLLGSFSARETPISWRARVAPGNATQRGPRRLPSPPAGELSARHLNVIREHPAENRRRSAGLEVGNLARGVVCAAAEDDGCGGDQHARGGGERGFGAPEGVLPVDGSYVGEA